MWVITHMLTGLALGTLLAGQHASLWLIVTAAVLLHLLLDLVPHWDYVHERHAALWVAGDLAATVTVVLLARIAGGFTPHVLIAGVVSALPDLDVLNGIRPTERRIRFFPSHWERFPHGSAGPVLGTLVQAVLWVASIAIMVAC